ncbi:hypothetical protein AJ80_02080 [Polytolypa hystricis UAMH7299]|uniref:C-CAP/cofactor C-like domain-containing protein n=1 Tax=Polytolypa hystricis (strain UAMH7299) TaxID=1447883 RepID=A0A2B7YSJ1_POLH7|nr:hypothetical protein AJ80_02080 [Polytolypa hystricis UAMH7299]
MASPEPQTPHEASNDGPASTGSDSSLSTRFFRYFQHEITALQEQMDRLGDTSLVGGERSDAVDHCLAGIARLSKEVQDASSYIPSYDQRIYAAAIKALQEKLVETKASFAPRSKFSFRSARRAPSTTAPPADAAETAQTLGRVPGFPPSINSVVSSSATSGLSTPFSGRNALSRDIADSLGPLANGTPRSEQDSIRRPILSDDSSVSIDSQIGVHIILPNAASQTSVPASITSLNHCVVDMPMSTGTAAADSHPFATLTVKHISESLLVCGKVNGPAHVTSVDRSVIVVSCHQFRMHDCVNVDVYLSCTSKPIIEDCRNIRFAKIPEAYPFSSTLPTESNLWDQVQDFKWIKVEPSPNWKVLEEEDAVDDATWDELVSGAPKRSVDDILQAVKIIKGMN